jgi:hypothetical protein
MFPEINMNLLDENMMKKDNFKDLVVDGKVIIIIIWQKNN